MIRDALEAKLLPREHLLWKGAPSQGLLFTSRDILLIPFSAAWLGFAIFWLGTVSRTKAPWFFELWGTMFVVIGLFFAAGRFAVDAWLRQRTQYAVTDQRIMIMRGGPFASFTSIDLDRLPEITVTGDGAPTGHIRFGPAINVSGNRRMAGWVPALDPVPQFLGVREPSVIYRMIMDAVRKTRDSRGPAGDA